MQACKPRPASASIIDRKAGGVAGARRHHHGRGHARHHGLPHSRGDSLELIAHAGLRHLLADAHLRRALLPFPGKRLLHGDIQQRAAQLVAALCVRGDPAPDGDRLLNGAGCKTVCLDFETWLLCAALASVMLWVSEGFKLIFYRRRAMGNPGAAGTRVQSHDGWHYGPDLEVRTVVFAINSADRAAGGGHPAGLPRSRRPSTSPIVCPVSRMTGTRRSAPVQFSRARRRPCAASPRR